MLPRSASPERITGLIDSALLELRSQPGVVAAGAANMTPMFAATAITTLTLEETAGAPAAKTARARSYVVTPGFAQALGLRLRAGRFFRDGDDRAGMRPIIVNEAFVQQHLSDGRPVVGRVFDDVYPTDKGTRTKIVGIVGNVLKDGNDAAPEPEVYVPNDWRGGPTRQRIAQFVNVAVRATSDPAAMAPALRDLIRRLDSTALVTRVEPLETTVSTSMAQPRFAARTIGAFALVALLLAAVGLFGVLSYTVAERRRELSIRAAIGARRASLIALVMREGLIVTVAGVVLGLLGAAALTRFMQAALFEITPLDPLSFAAAPLLLIPIAVLACLGPALRAASADPATVLRST